MYWADELAKKIIKSSKHKPYWVDDMKTPSGRVHIGSVRAVVTHELLWRALIDQGVKATFSYVLEDHDPLDKLPSYLNEKKYRPHLGKPLFKIPAPKPGFSSYGAMWGQQYQEVFNSVGVYPQVIWGSQLYLSGKMNPLIKLCLNKANKIRKIYFQLYGQKKPSNWFPFNVVCEKCGKLLTTRVTGWDGNQVVYACAKGAIESIPGCGYQGSTSPFSNKNRFAGKLPWKVEWPCKWKVIGVTVEGAGKDHMTEGGSHDFAKLMCKAVINYPVPFYFSHEFFLVGGRKMSSSRGTGASAKEISEIIPPFLIRFMIARVRYNRAINFDPGGMTIPDLYDAYDEAALSYWNKKDKKLARIFELSQVKAKPPKQHFLARFRDVAQFIQHPEIDIYNKFDQIKGSSLTKFEKDVLEDRIKYAQIWLDGYAPKEAVFIPAKKIPPEVANLTRPQLNYLSQVLSLLNQDWKQPEDLQQALYDEAKAVKLSPQKAFAAIYLSLIGKDHGPRAAWFLLEYRGLAKKRFRKVAEVVRRRRQRLKKGKLPLVSERIGLEAELAERYPSIRVGYALIEDVRISKSDKRLEKEKKEVLESLAGLTTEEIGRFSEIQSYRKLYREMGVDWHSRRPSPEALLRRVALGKGLYSINTCVDAYNLVVMKERVSSGAFDAEKIYFPCEVRIAKGGEKILLLGDSRETVLKQGEVCYFDQKGPFNLDYNYRDAQRSLVSEETTSLWINIDGVYQISVEQVQRALEQTIEILTRYCGGKVVDQGMIAAG